MRCGEHADDGSGHGERDELDDHLDRVRDRLRLPLSVADLVVSQPRLGGDERP